MKRNLLFFIFPFLLTTYAYPQQGCFGVLDQTFDSITSQSQIWGLSAAMILPDGSLWKRAAGLAQELPEEQVLTTDHVMPIGSVTKSFTAATILLMMEDGLLSLEDSIGMYLAPYPNVRPEITIRQLLNHRSGVMDYLTEDPALVDNLLQYPDSIWVIDTILNNYVLDANFLPGSAWKYSNTNYLLLSRVMENITGQNWYEVVRERILDPLELTHTYAYPYESPSQPFAHAWDDILGNGFEDIQGNGFSFDAILSIGGGAGGLISNPEDMARFIKLLHEGHLLQASTLEEMHTDYNPGGGIYGLGARSLGNDIWGHGGAVFYLSRAYYYTNCPMTLVVQQNDSRLDGPNNHTLIDYRELENALRDAVYNCTKNCKVDTHQEDNIRPAITLAPNPAQDELRLAIRSEVFVENAALQIFSPAGQLVFAGKLDAAGRDLSETLDISQLPPGFYFLKIGLNRETVVRKFVKSD